MSVMNFEKTGSGKNGDNSAVMKKIFNSGYYIALLTFICTSLSSLCDGIISSRLLSVAALAAIGIAHPYSRMIDCMSKIFSAGSQILISRKIGQNRFEEISCIFYTSLIAISTLSVAVAATILIFAEPVSTMFGAREANETLQLTAAYLRTLAFGAPAQMLLVFFVSLLQFDNKKRLVNIATVIMMGVNITLNLIFAGMNMGISGIGMSTSISYYAALIVLCTYFAGKKKSVITRGKMAFSRLYLKEIITDGIPTALKDLTAIVRSTSINNVIAAVGTTETMAAYSMYKLTKFIFLSVSEAVGSPVRMVQSMLFEEKDRNGLKNIFIYANIKGLLLSVALSGIMLLCGRWAFSFIVSETVLKELLIIYRSATVIFLFNTLTTYYLNYYQAIKKKKMAYSMPIILNCVSVALILPLSSLMGTEGIWLACVIVQIGLAVYAAAAACIMGRNNKRFAEKLTAIPADITAICHEYAFHIDSFESAKQHVMSFGEACKEIGNKKKAYYCCLALEEIVFNIINHQKSANGAKLSIDVHILIFNNSEAVIRIKDDSSERNPFEKYELKSDEDDFKNIGIKMIKSIAKEVKYSFIYGMNFFTITL